MQFRSGKCPQTLKIRFGHDSGICLETDEEGKLITKLRIHYE